jgi:2-C-methyl-D-erythritol 4-phosphate cytidylyltransferase/2-C-methyl-D-erythritol 2,4-cyclodiphosphate synthase
MHDTSKQHRIAALIVAAGRGARAERPGPKQYELLAGKTVLARAVEAFTGHPLIDAVLVVIHRDDEALYRQAMGDHEKLLPPVFGGETRQASVLAGLEQLAQIQPLPDQVLIHDGARPFVGEDLITAVCSTIEPDAGAMPVLAISETIKRAEEGQVAETVPRSGLHLAQTPQGFAFTAILNAHRTATADQTDLTDDEAVAAHAGLVVRTVPGDRRNIKLTDTDDFRYAQAMISQPMETWTGQGFDVHALVPGDHVMLCGVKIPHTRGLKGHSDADAALHALTDALYGALGEGDIGHHFPPSDPNWRGADSAIFLREAIARLEARGGRINNLDVTVICEAPKIGPHRQAMRQAIATIAGIEPRRVSVKGTTSERLGFAGRGEGVAALATATIQLPAL